MKAPVRMSGVALWNIIQNCPHCGSPVASFYSWPAAGFSLTAWQCGRVARVVNDRDVTILRPCEEEL